MTLKVKMTFKHLSLKIPNTRSRRNLKLAGWQVPQCSLTRPNCTTTKIYGPTTLYFDQRCAIVSWDACRCYKSPVLTYVVVLCFRTCQWQTKATRPNTLHGSFGRMLSNPKNKFWIRHYSRIIISLRGNALQRPSYAHVERVSMDTDAAASGGDAIADVAQR